MLTNIQCRCGEPLFLENNKLCCESCRGWYDTRHFDDIPPYDEEDEKWD